MSHYPPPRQCQGRGGDLNYAKVKCITYWASHGQSVKSQSSPHQKDGDIRGDLLVNVHTYVHAYGERSFPNSNCKIISPIKNLAYAA